MGLRNIFKKKKKLEKVKEPPKESLPEREQVPYGTDELAVGQTKERKPKKVEKRKIPEIAYKVLISPHVTERATDLVSKNQYVFKVFPRANKIKIKKTIEQVYGVDVLAVKIINVPKKPKRLGRISGWKKGYKKAIVKIKEGQKIKDFKP